MTETDTDTGGQGSVEGGWYQGGAHGPCGAGKDHLCRRARTFLLARLDGDQRGRVLTLEPPCQGCFTRF